MAKQSSNKNEQKKPLVDTNTKPIVETKTAIEVQKVESNPTEESTGDIFNLQSATIFKDKKEIAPSKLKDAWGRK